MHGLMCVCRQGSSQSLVPSLVRSLVQSLVQSLHLARALDMFVRIDGVVWFARAFGLFARAFVLL